MSDVHKDFFGKTLTEGLKVIVPRGNSLVLCSVTRLTPKMALVTPIGKKSKGYYIYPSQMVVVDSEDVVAYILKNHG